MNGYRRCAPIEKASTGNDLVFLPATRPERTSLPRFYSRILTTAEAEGFARLASSGIPFDHYVWLCWSIKESVYKFQKRLFPGLVFAPLRIAIGEITPPAGDRDYYAGVVAGEPACEPEPGRAAEPGCVSEPYSACEQPGAPILYSRSMIRQGLIATVVSEDQSFKDTHWGFSIIDSTAYANQSAGVRALALKELKTVLSRDDLRLEKDAAGCPVVLAGDELLAIPVSLAHHERYIAYSFRNKIV